VVDRQGRIGAVITDRDICMGAFTQGKLLAELRVADSMSGDVATVRADDDLSAAVLLMCERQVRRLPVVDDQGKPCGVLSLNDLAVVGEQAPEVDAEAAKVLAAVCRRRAAVPAEVPPLTVEAPPLTAPSRRASKKAAAKGA
jgi:signal-transduction protein with cAMP-binding, CBS, and nucleotidyltransferase domain